MERRRMLVLVGALVLVASACGGDDTTDPTVDTQASQDGGSGTSDGGSGTGDGSTGSDGGSDGGGGERSGAPEIDPDDMPAPGEIVLEVDGQTFTVTADDVDFYTCDIDEGFINVRAESASQNWTVQIDTVSGRANASLQLNDPGIVYTSFTGPEVPGGASVEAPYVLYEAPFTSYPTDDLADVTELGTGRASVTCP